MQYTKATKKQSRLRLALIGPSGSGKTYTALTLAQGLGKKIALIDTERGSASKYSDLFDFDVLELDTFSPRLYVEAIHLSEQAGYEVLIIDSLSHAWAGKDGTLEQVDRIAKRLPSQNTFAAWREVTPMHNALVDAMLQSRLHLIATMRTKTDYIIEPNDKGRLVPRKVGLAPIQRDGVEYEFDVVADLDLENNLVISKTRCPELHGVVISKPDVALAETLKTWLTDGIPAPEAETSISYRQAGQRTSGNGQAKGPNSGDGEENHHSSSFSDQQANAPQRPYPAHVLRDKLNEFAALFTKRRAVVTQEERAEVVMIFASCFSDQEDGHDCSAEALNWLFSVGSTAELNDAQVLAIRKWLNSQPAEAGEFHPDEFALQEANLLCREALVETGERVQ
jgi:hypothetical protein